MGLLPHRYPFALVDRVLEHEPGVRAVAIKNITLNEPQFQGHFPDRPLMPGVLIVEAMAQVGGLIVKRMPDLPMACLCSPGLMVFASAGLWCPVISCVSVASWSASSGSGSAR